MSNKDFSQLLTKAPLKETSLRHSLDHIRLSWKNKAILSKTDAYEISWYNLIPETIQTKLEQYPEASLRIWYTHKLYVLLTKAMLIVDQSGLKMEVSVQDMMVYDQPFLFDVRLDPFVCVIVSVQGHIRWIQHDKFPSDYTIPITDGITTVKMINMEQILLGTVSGDIYLCHKDGLFKFYKQQSWFDAFMLTGSYHFSKIPSLSEQFKQDHGSITCIQFVNSIAYISTTKAIHLWNMEKHKIQYIAHCMIEETIKNKIKQHIPDYYVKKDLQCEIVGMNVHSNRDIVLLISYSLPNMQGYVQYFVIKCQLEKEQEHLVAHIICGHSLAFTTLKRKAHLISTKDIAFVSFKDTVIATSIDKTSIFEASVYVQDQVLYTEIVQENTVLIYTRQQGAIRFTVDVDKILSSWLTDNMYARAVKNIEESDTRIFQSKLEQAVFFGDAPNSPLQFPIRRQNQENVSRAALDLSNSILNGQCRFLSLDMDLSTFSCAQYYFQKRIYTVLKENDIYSWLSKQDRFKLFQRTETSIVCHTVSKYMAKSQPDQELRKKLLQIMHSVSSSQIQDLEEQLRYFFKRESESVVHLLKMVHIEACSEQPTTDFFYYAMKLMVKALSIAHYFEDKHTLEYDMNTTQPSIAAMLCDYLTRLWIKGFDMDSQDTVQFGHSERASLRPMVDIASLLLNTLSKQKTEDAYQIFRDTRHLVFHRLLEDQDLICKLVKKYGGASSLVQIVQTSAQSVEKKRERHLAYIQHLGYPYFSCLLLYLSQKDQYDLVEDYSTQFNQFVAPFLNQYPTPRMAWIYYLHRKDYIQSYQQLLLCFKTHLPKEERLNMMAWKTLLEKLIKST
ncbi:uncharacterized protein B0P05DRAFT_553046 [Gilbertella persicaria]|uniref:uncharacterized protein n=1 Tax=Gilbertella persicaria TaxID=101096 RepID=UPI00221F327D|nr:uncharacterized protein B0P05DRAFT_553046 [Gilbertella persicaria]KAI8066970.1 hypothetical protein B0P05DRAFT_553046 [Gilbertella persicaria]